MVVVADASVAIRGDMSGWDADLKNAERSTQGFFGRIQSGAKGVLSALTLIGVGTSLPGLIRNTVAMLGDAAQAYAELEQTVRTIDSVFGDSAGIIRDWGETAAESAGMSQQTFMSSAAVMGQTLLNMGFAADEAAEKTTQLLARAADLAIAFGKRPQDALLAITAAMRGERDTIEKFGVAIKQVDVNARISALGLDTSTAAAKKNAEAIAVVDLVLMQSAENAGRFASSQDDLAVKMAVVNAKWADFLALDVGAAVASIQLGAFEVGDAVGDTIDKLSLHFGDHLAIVEQLAEQEGTTVDQMKQHIVETMHETGESFKQITDGMRDDVALAAAAMAMEMPKGIAAMEEALKLGGPVIAAEAGKIAGMLPSEIRAQIDDVKQAAEDMLGPDGLAGGILAAQQKPIDAIAELNRVMDESLSAAEQIAYLTGEDALTSLNEGLNSPLLVDRLTAKDALAKVVEQLQTLGPAGYAAAVALLNQLGYGFNDPVALGTATQMARRAAGVVRGVFPFSEPKDPLSPFRGITNWGGNIVKMIAEGMDGQLGTASASARALAGALVPSLPDMAISGMANSSGVGVPMMGQNIQYVLSVEGLPVVIGSAEDVMERWKQMTSLSRDGVQ
jgi:hypothetical protein